MNISIEERASSIEQYGLAGQRPYAHGLTPINVREVLHCDEIQKLEHEQEYAAWLQKEGIRSSDVYSVKIFRFTNGYLKAVTFHRMKVILGMQWFFKDRAYFNPDKYCNVKRVALQEYSIEPIPSDAMNAIKHAVECGLDVKDMQVCYPVVESIKQKDPVIIYRKGEQDFLIAQW